MKTFINHSLISEAAEAITNNYTIGYKDIKNSICFINPKQYEPGQTAYNILNPDLFIYTPQIKELFKQIDQYTAQIETYAGELDQYNQQEKYNIIEALNNKIKSFYL